jgi:hypothetical protein
MLQLALAASFFSDFCQKDVDASADTTLSLTRKYN